MAKPRSTKAAPQRARKRTSARAGRDWTLRFLEALKASGVISEACKAAGINRSTAYKRRQADEDFALAWHDVEEEATDLLEAVAYQRATEQSDQLIIFLLKARRPATFNERHILEHAGRVEHRHRVDLSRLTDEELETYERLVARTATE